MGGINTAPVEIILIDTDERVDIQVCDANGDPIDVDTGNGGEIDLIIKNPAGNIIHIDNFPSGIAPDPTRIVKPVGTVGQYYFLLGDPTATVNIPNNTETNTSGDYLFRWRVLQSTGVETVSQIQIVKVITDNMVKYMTNLRLQIDKAAKLVDDDPLMPCRTGYTDDMLVQFIEDGLTLINAAQPYPTFCNVDAFPFLFKQVLMECALLVGIMTQQLFAIDTDIPNYSDNGNAFVLDHFPRLMQYAQVLREDLKQRIPDLKRHFISTGSIHIQASPNYRLNQLVQTAPNGALFRNFFMGII